MRKFLVLLCSCLVSQLLVAQLQSDSTGSKKKKKATHSFYGTAGLHLSGINGDSESYDSPLFGFHAGVGIRLVELNDIFGVRTEVIYSMQGSKYKDMYASGKVILSYIHVPVVLQATSGSGFYGEAGVQPGFLISAKDKYGGETFDYKEFVNGFDFGGILGIGYQKDRFGIGFRFAQGLSNINKNDEVNKDRNFVGTLRTTFAF
ncbi:MAG: PorT family protein [Sphingobacteriales bacterium]|nr:PorT family protein [Sphingobacteriales bacterium]